MTFAAPLEAKSIRFRARSFVAFTLTPEAPLDVWLEGLDHWIGNSPGYFAGRPVVLDLNTLKPDVAAIESLVDVLGHRGIRVYAIELDGHAALAPNLPPVLVGAKEATTDGLLPREARAEGFDKAEGRAAEQHADAGSAAKAGDGKAGASKAGDSEPQVEASGTLMIKAPIRSGQAIVHPHGDVIVLGSVASGSEIIAAGSIHVYGTLRGRASAGALGNR
ncbi:septum formation inhibitor MinC, partial [Mesorhizobium sp. M7A.F.Ca.CA.002.14.1.2]